MYISKKPQRGINRPGVNCIARCRGTLIGKEKPNIMKDVWALEKAII